jgi:hypothetical protein
MVPLLAISTTGCASDCARAGPRRSALLSCRDGRRSVFLSREWPGDTTTTRRLRWLLMRSGASIARRSRPVEITRPVSSARASRLRRVPTTGARCGAVRVEPPTGGRRRLRLVDPKTLARPRRWAFPRLRLPAGPRGAHDLLVRTPDNQAAGRWPRWSAGKGAAPPRGGDGRPRGPTPHRPGRGRWGPRGLSSPYSARPCQDRGCHCPAGRRLLPSRSKSGVHRSRRVLRRSASPPDGFLRRLEVGLGHAFSSGSGCGEATELVGALRTVAPGHRRSASRRRHVAT